MGYALGVDLGTTYTAAAVSRGRQAEVVPLGDRASQVPSVIFRPVSGPLVFGEAAARHAVTEPDRVAREFKRRIGDQTDIYLGGTPMSAPALSHALLEWVVQRVTDGQGEPPAIVTVTYPANWGPFRRELLDQVVALDAGIPTLVCSEPEAAAVHFAMSGRLAPGQPIAVYDLGGGTFDAAILRPTDGAGFELVGAPEGLEQLGGVDFDEAVFRHVLAAANIEGLDLDPDDDEVVAGLAQLRRECVDAKEALTTEVSVTVSVPFGGRRAAVRLNRQEFEELIRPLVLQTVAALHRAIRRANLSPDQLGAVLLVGGSSRVPLVAELLTDALRRPVVVTSQPKLSVAMGAALLGAAELVPAESRSEADVTPPLSIAHRARRIASLQSSIRSDARAGDSAAVIAAGKELAALDPRQADPDGLVTQARQELAVARRRQLAALFERSVDAESAGRWPEAVDALQQLTTLDPANTEAAERLVALRVRLAVPSTAAPGAPDIGQAPTHGFPPPTTRPQHGFGQPSTSPPYNESPLVAASGTPVGTLGRGEGTGGAGATSDPPQPYPRELLHPAAADPRIASVAWTGSTAPPRRPRSRTIVAALVALIVALLGGVTAVVWTSVHRRQTRDAQTTLGTSVASPTQRLSAAPTSPAATSPSATSPSPTPTARTSSSKARSVLDEPSRTRSDPKIVTAAGKSCRNLGRPSDYGEYPVAICDQFRSAESYGTGRSAKKNPRKTVICQRDLGIPNPTYTTRQTNTWWFWARSDDGTFGWFPETALAEGLPNLPIDKVALCAY